MSSYLITGGSGVGKSTIIEELARRGHQTYTDDDPKLAGFYDAKGRRLPRTEWPKQHPINFDRYKYKWHVPALKKLLATHHGTIFVGGVAWNISAVIPLFDIAFVLQPNLETLKYRLKTRTDNAFGKHPDELAGILEQFDPTGDLWRSEGAIVIDANRPVVQVADDILAHIGENTKAAA